MAESPKKWGLYAVLKRGNHETGIAYVYEYSSVYVLHSQTIIPPIDHPAHLKSARTHASSYRDKLCGQGYGGDEVGVGGS